MVRKLVIIGGSVLAVGLVAVALLAWWGYTVMTGPMYVPGALAGGRANRPFDADGSRAPWRVEREVEIHHVARGDGRPVLYIHGGPGIPVRDPAPWLVELEGSFEVHY
jgi:proline iminopeptidase